jgi:hypothetical protein
MNERESDPTGAFRGGSAGLEDDSSATKDAGTEYERHAPDGAQPGGDRPNDGRLATADGRAANETPGVDETERDVVTSGTAATSEVGDPDAQAHAEGQGDGTPQHR